MAVAVRQGSRGLPRELDSFVGRGRDLDEVRRHLSNSRLVTLTGPGGVGKTRLALRSAARSVKAFPDGVWLVELGQLVSDVGLERFVLRSLGALDASAAPDLDQLVDYLLERDLLLLLDNCEHVIEAVATLAHRLLRSCPGLRILATSRETLGVPGEHPYEVSPLGLPGGPDAADGAGGGSAQEAMSLFADRAAAAVPGFTITDDNRSSVERIVTQLDGLPLAIELAAARLRAMSGSELADRLADSYRLLSHGSRTAPSRHQTLRLCVDWSYEQCSEVERLLWDRLSVFVGGFEVDAVEGVVAFGGLSVDHVFDLLSSLVAKSIVARVASPDRARFKLLETLRQYGRERLEERGELEQTELRHRDWHAAFVQRSFDTVIGPHQGATWSRLDREQANLRVSAEVSVIRAMRSGRPDGADARVLAEMTVALFPYWVSRGMLTGARTLAEHALKVTEGAPSELRVQLLVDDGTYAVLQGNHAGSAERMRQAEQEAAALGDDEAGDGLSPAVRVGRGFLALLSGDFATARSVSIPAVEASRGEGDELRLARALINIVAASAMAGSADTEYEAYFAEGLALLESRGESYYRGHWLTDQAHLRMQTGDLSAALDGFVRGMRLHASVGARLAFVWGLASAALCEGLLGHHERAVVLQAAHDRSYVDLGLTQAPNLRSEAQQAREQAAREALGPRGYQAAHDRGWGMDPDTRIAYATGTDPTGRSSTDSTGPAAPSLLTERELQVAVLVADGLTNREIALRLVVTPRTIRGHVENIMGKLGVSTRSAIASWYVTAYRDD